MTAPLFLQTLGVPHVWVSGQAQALSGKSMALLMYLALEGPVHREVLTELLWTDKAGQGARGNLRQELYRLRGKLPGLALSVDGDWIGLSGAEVDLRQLRTHLEAGRWQQAAELVGGEFLLGLSPPAAEGFDEWREQQAGQSREDSLRALGEWAAELERRGDYRAALGVHDRACSLDDLSERHQAAVIRLLLALGQREAARARAERLEQLLRRELGVAPGPETRALIELSHAPPSQAALPLTGREEALYALSGSRVTLIVGEAGVGKTRLAQAAVARPGLTVQGLADLSGIPYAALAEALGSLPQAWPLPGTPERRALARLLPHTGEAEQPIAEDRALFVRLLSQVLSAALSGAVLIVEDLHWLDSGTLDVVAYLIRHTSSRVILTARAEELRERRELTGVLDALSRDQLLVRLPIADLSESQLGQLIAAIIGHPAPLFSQRLYRATAGHPLFVLETLRDLRERGELRQVGGLWQTPYDELTLDYAEILTPASVSAAIDERLSRLGEGTRRVLQAAAASSEALSAAQLAEVSGLSEWDAVAALEQAQAARLMTAQHDTYVFGHELYRRATVVGVSGARKQTLHRALAGVLARAGAQPARVAEHLEQAGERTLAWPQWREAARRAAQLFAHAEALSYLRRALACSPADTDAFDLLAEQIDLLRHTDDQSARLAVLEQMQSLAASLGDPERQAEAAARFASYLTEHDDYAGAVRTALDTLSAVAERASPERRAALHLEAGAALACQGEFAAALNALEQALRLSPAATPRRANVLYWMGHCAEQSGDLSGAAAHYLTALLGLPPQRLTRGRVLTLWKLGQVQIRLGQFAEARRHLSLAETEASTLDSAPLRLLCAAALGHLALSEGRTDEARRWAERARQLGSHDSEGQGELARLDERLARLPR